MSTKSIINKEPVDIIIPTYDNLGQFVQCVKSMWQTHNQYPMRFIIINNGTHPLEAYLPQNDPSFVIINPGKNLGWTGGLIEGLKHSTSKYVIFANDDVFVPLCSLRWLSQMTRHLALNKNCAAVGPTSNCVMGTQNIFGTQNYMCYTTSFLIGFLMCVRRSTLDEVGGVDPEFHTGDDIDLSMRFTKAGYHMMVDASIFIYHYGFQTGTKLYGGPEKAGGWNSSEMTDETNIHLIKKHGFLEWWYVRVGYPEDYHKNIHWHKPRNETSIVLSHVNGCPPMDIVDLGCGGSKTVKGSIGVDMVSRGDPVVNTAFCCEADVKADVEKEMPFKDGRFKTVIARHILEHCTDVIGALEEWRRILADDGQMILCLPDERISDTIILNPEHVHAFTPDTLTKIVNKVGLQVEKIHDFYEDDSFTMVLRKCA